MHMQNGSCVPTRMCAHAMSALNSSAKPNKCKKGLTTSLVDTDRAYEGVIASSVIEKLSKVDCMQPLLTKGI